MVQANADPRILNEILQRASDGLKRNTDPHVGNYISNAQQANDIAGMALTEVVKSGNKGMVRDFAKLANVRDKDVVTDLEERADVINATQNLADVTAAEDQRLSSRRDIGSGFVSGATLEPTVPYSVLEEKYLEAQANERPWQFDDPWGEFWLPMLLGARPGNIILSNIERQEKQKAIAKQLHMDRNWFNSYQKRIDNKSPHAEAFSETAAEFGYVPSGASSLEALSKEDRDALVYNAVQQNMQDPTLIDTVSNINNPTLKVQMLHTLAFLKSVMDNGGYVPKRLEDFYLNIMMPEVGQIERELKAAQVEEHAYRSAWGAERAARRAEQEPTDTTTLTPSQRKAKEKEVVTEKERKMVPSTPISASDRAKYGLNKKFQTYEDIASAGFRLPEASDRRQYSELRASYATFKNLEDELFGKDGIFKGIGTGTIDRGLSRAGLFAAVREGTQRGRNFEYYNDKMGFITRRLIVAAGESGGRYTEQDVLQMMKAAPDPMGLQPDSEEQARKKFLDTVNELENLMDFAIGGVLLEPGQTIRKPWKVDDGFNDLRKELRAADFDDYEIEKYILSIKYQEGE